MKTPWHEYRDVFRFELWALGICERFTQLNTQVQLFPLVDYILFFRLRSSHNKFGWHRRKEFLHENRETSSLTDVVNGAWGQWGPWSACSETEFCNRGAQVRTRLCDSPAPQDGGELCPGTGSESQECPKTNCKGTHFFSQYLKFDYVRIKK